MCPLFFWQENGTCIGDDAGADRYGEGGILIGRIAGMELKIPCSGRYAAEEVGAGSRVG